MKYFLFTVALLSSLSAMTQSDIEEGKKIFMSRCASCHAIDKRAVGPALQNVHERHDESWIVNFVYSSQSMIKEGDAAAVALFKEYNQMVMPDHKDLSEVQIKNIIAYIYDAGENVAVNKTAPVTTTYSKPYRNKKSILQKVVYLNLDSDQRPLDSTQTVAWFTIGGLVIILIITLHAVVYSNQVADTGRASGKNKPQKVKEAEMEPAEL